MNMYVIIAGNPLVGFDVYGTFPDERAAEEYGEINLTEYWIIELTPPLEENDDE